MSKISPQLIRVGHSPDPDDAFMFYALAHEKMDMRGFKVEHVIEDIESLNQRALQLCPSFAKRGQGRFASQIPLDPPLQKGEEARGTDALEVTAVSCHAYAYLSDKYAVMRSGASVGDGYGPILVRRGLGTRDSGLDLKNKRVAVPGKLTTAYLALQLHSRMSEIASGKSRPRNDVIARRPKAEEAILFEPVFVPFDKIFNAVKNGDADYGLVIHEGQLTHAAEGFEKVLDLGEWWHETTQLPLPLGVDVIRKDLGPETMKRFAALFKESIQYALNHREDALEYASQFGRGITHDLNDRFVAMYVNDRTVDLGPDGEAGFRKLLDMAYQHGIIPKKVELEFV